MNQILCWILTRHNWDGFYATAQSPSDGELYIVYCQDCGAIKFVEKH